jgi:DNA-binding response OmpR family regulator
MVTKPIKPTVMMLEPDVLVRHAVSEHLREVGFFVIEGITAEDGHAVLASRRDVDVFIADLALAGEMDGVSFARAIRQTHPELDVILTFKAQRMPDKPHELGSFGPLQKPYHPWEAESRIRALLDRRRGAKN